MFRLKIILVYFALTVLGVIIALLTIADRREVLEKELRQEVAKSEGKYAQVQQLRRFALKDMAAWLSQSELRAYMIELAARRDELLQKLEWAYGTVDAGSSDTSFERREAALLKDQNPWLTEVANSLADRIERIRGPEAWTEGEGRQNRDAFVDKTKKDLAKCNAQTVAKCYYEFTYHAMVDLAKTLRTDTSRFGLAPTLLLAADDRLSGIADPDNPSYSKDTSLKDRYRLLSAVKQGQVVVDALVLDKNKSILFVCGVPLLDGGTFRGALLVGVEVDTDLVKREKDLVGYEVSYFLDRSLMRSTVGEERHGRLLGEQVPARFGKPPAEAQAVYELNADNVAGLFIPITGIYSNTALQVLLSVDVGEAVGDLDLLATLVPLYGLLIFFIGTLLFLFIIRLHLQPFERIELGIHEVINGNTEYEFPFGFREKMWQSLGQGLNLMVGLLLGRQILDEDEFDEWAKKYLEDERKARESGEEDDEDEDEEEEEEEASAEPSDSRAGKSKEPKEPKEPKEKDKDVQSPAVLPVADPKLANEPPEDYYRRIYGEFAKLRRDGDEPITYVKFVEKVVRQERMLRHQHKCRMVRFNIAKGADGPVFVPVKID